MRMLIITCNSATHARVAFRMALISSYFKPAQETLDLPHPGTSQQGGEAHDSDNKVTQERVGKRGDSEGHR